MSASRELQEKKKQISGVSLVLIGLAMGLIPDNAALLGIIPPVVALLLPIVLSTKKDPALAPVVAASATNNVANIIGKVLIFALLAGSLYLAYMVKSEQ